MPQINGIEIAPAPQWLLDLITFQDDTPKAPTLRLTPLVTPESSNQKVKYVRSGFEKELALLVATQPGSQSNQLNKSAFKIGTLVGTGLLSYQEAEAALLNAALSLSNGDKSQRWTERNALPQIRSGLTAGQKKPRVLPENDPSVILKGRAARSWIRGARPELAQIESDEAEIEAQAEANLKGEEAELEVLDESGLEKNASGSYGVQYGRTMFISVRKAPAAGEMNTTSSAVRVADFAAHIAEEIAEEDGSSIYKIEGRTRLGRRFEIEIEGTKFQDVKQLMALLSNAVGAGCVFYSGMEKHLPAAIRSNSPNAPRSRRFNRTGWHGTGDKAEFVIPGREKPNTSISLGAKLAFHIAPDAELETGLQALENLINAQNPNLTTVALATFFQAPLAQLCGWRDERYGVFIAGRTGSFKSSWALLAMSLYGPKFASEDHAIKFGIGATNNSIMSNMAGAGDMPLLVDNYKPNTGYGAKDLVNLIHMVMEGSERDRLTRDSKQRVTRSIHAWPIFTGEDFPDDDAATTARMLIVPFPYMGGGENAALSFAQENSHHLCAVGGAILDWLHTPEARQAAVFARKQFLRRRTHWSTILRAIEPEMVNISRVATNLASNEATWELFHACPALKPLVYKYAPQHAAGLMEVAKTMSQQTANAFEAVRYLEAIRALLQSGRAYLANRLSDPDDANRKICLGWEDENGAYLIGAIAYAEAGKLTDFNKISKNTIHKQLAQIGALAEMGSDGKLPVLKRCGAIPRPVRVLHLKTSAIYGGDEKESE